MGWTFYNKPKGIKAVDSILSGCGAKWIADHYVASSATREAVFIVAKFHDPDSKVYVPDADGMIRAILVYAIRSVPKDFYNFGYKDMEESMGPYGCPCPASIIEQASPLRPKSEIDTTKDYSSLKSAHEYREASLQYKAAKAKKRGLKPGQKVKLAEPLSFAGQMLDEFTVVRVRTRKGMTTAFSASNGMLCAIRAASLADATITG
jgi:hypothetical protein